MTEQISLPCEAEAFRKRVRVLFVNCPRLDTMACSYLILAQNEVQRVLEFEVYHLWIYAAKTASLSILTKLLRRLANLSIPFRSWFQRRYTNSLDLLAAPFLRSPMPTEECLDQMRQLLGKHDAWLNSLPRRYGNWSIQDAPTIVITETPFVGNYYAWAGDDLAVISVGQWQRYFAPPSVLEFILSRVQRYALRIGLQATIGSHYPTRGCIWDFDANVEDAKIGVLVGSLCSTCEATLLEEVDPQQLKSLKELLGHKWLGRVDKAGSVASNLKRTFHYDLTRTKGISPSLWERLVEVGSSKILEWLIPFILGFLALKLIQTLDRLPEVPSDLPSFIR